MCKKVRVKKKHVQIIVIKHSKNVDVIDFGIGLILESKRKIVNACSSTRLLLFRRR